MSPAFLLPVVLDYYREKVREHAYVKWYYFIIYFIIYVYECNMISQSSDSNQQSMANGDNFIKYN